MLALVLATALAATPAQSDLTRSVVTDVCLPYVTGETDNTIALESLGFLVAPPTAEGRMYSTQDQAYLLRLTTTGTAADGNLNRVCVIQARRGGLDAARGAVQPVMRDQGFAADADQPADRPIWTKGGVTVSIRQNPGASAVVRVTWSSLDAGL